MAKQASRSRSIKIGLLVVAAIVAVFVLVAVAGNFVGDDEDGAPVAVASAAVTAPALT